MSTNLSKKSSILKSPELLVNKYEPSTFSDLLSDDVINRQVAQWLTCWDNIVFPEKNALFLKFIIFIFRKVEIS